MCTGIHDAFNLSWRLEAAIAGEADDLPLGTYEAERAPHVSELTAKELSTSSCQQNNQQGAETAI
jgi:2-polyprenyl-6-methoxyphenol hydroxylase-like FAD-dependent oxidoreductase